MDGVKSGKEDKVKDVVMGGVKSKLEKLENWKIAKLTKRWVPKRGEIAQVD